MSEQPKPETLAEIYELVEGSLDRQFDEGQALDSKIVQIFGAASVVAGLVGFSVSGDIGDTATAILVVLAFVAYGGVAWIAFGQLAPKAYQLLNYPDVWRKSWNSEPHELHHSVIAKVVENLERNEPVLQAKAKALRLLVGATGAEVVLVGLALASSLFG